MLQITLPVTLRFTHPVEDLAAVQQNVMDALIEQLESDSIAPAGESAITSLVVVGAPDGTELAQLEYDPFAPGRALL